MTGAPMNPGRPEQDRNEVRTMKYYFAYGSNMNLDQMAYRCPDAEVVGRCVLKDYRLAFRGNRRGYGVASILPEPGSEVQGLLWKITPKCEQSLDFYEGYPNLYEKKEVIVQTRTGEQAGVAVYIMNEPYQSQPAIPSDFYLKGILDTEGFCEPEAASELLESLSDLRDEIGGRTRSILFRIGLTSKHLRDIGPEFIELYDSLPERIRKHNDELADRLAKDVGATINPVEGYDLDAQQLRSIAMDVRNRLIIAGAGTGKTVSAKIYGRKKAAICDATILFFYVSLYRYVKYINN